MVGLPLASVTLTVAVEVEAPSAAMGLGEKLHDRPAAGPGLNTIEAVVPVTDGEVMSLNEIVHPVVAALLANVKVARPAFVVAVEVVAVAPDAGVSAAGQPVPAVPLVA